MIAGKLSKRGGKKRWETGRYTGKRKKKKEKKKEIRCKLSEEEEENEEERRVNAKCRLQKKMASYQIISRIKLVHHNRVLTRKILISEEKCPGDFKLL